MMRLRERDRIVWPQTIQSPTTTMSNDKVDQWMQSAAAMSSDKVEHAVPVRTHPPPHAVPSVPQPTHSGRSLTCPGHYLRTQPPPKTKPKTSKQTAESDEGLQDQVDADSVGRWPLSTSCPVLPPLRAARSAPRRLSALRLVEPPSMALLRVALLCHLFVSVAGADRVATNVACLPNEPGQVFTILAGASATQRS